jgi:hypothetical protein
MTKHAPIGKGVIKDIFFMTIHGDPLINRVGKGVIKDI